MLTLLLIFALLGMVIIVGEIIYEWAKENTTGLVK